MKQRHLFYNVIGVTIGLLLGIGGCCQVLLRYRAHTSLLACAMAGFIGVGSFTNLANKNLGKVPTIATIIGYFISIIMIPLGIWGIYLLVTEPKRRHRSHR